MVRTWTEWTGAVAWAEALTDWHRVTWPDQWPEDHDEHQDDVQDTDMAAVVLLIAVAIQAAARLTGCTVSRSPDDLGRVPFALIDAFVDTRMARAVLYHSAGLGPTHDQPGAGRPHARLLATAEGDTRWHDLVQRAAAVIRAHRADIHPDDALPDTHALADRRLVITLATQWLYPQ
jgi:hypothetical protein